MLLDVVIIFEDDIMKYEGVKVWLFTHASGIWRRTTLPSISFDLAIVIGQGSHWPGKSEKTWKQKWSGKVGENQGPFYISPKNQGKSENFFWNANCHENQKYWDLHLKMLWLSFLAPGKTPLKMSKIVREICVQVWEKVRESRGTCFQIFGGIHVAYSANLTMVV